MINPLLVFIGGGTGAVARYGVSHLVGQFTRDGFPYPTLTINLLGAFLIGLFAGFEEMHMSHPSVRFLLVTGFLGGYTTFSTFSLESALLLQRGDYLGLALYVGVSVLGTVALVFAGSALMRAFG